MRENNQPALAHFSWLDIDDMARTLAAKILADGYRPDAIVAILRGGAVPAVHLSHLLDVRIFYTLHIQTTLSNQFRSQRQEPQVVAHTLPPDLSGKHILLVDDVVNTGMTLQVAKRFFETYTPDSIKTCVLLWDTVPAHGMNSVPDIEADYYVKTVPAWVVFPWNI